MKCIALVWMATAIVVTGICISQAEWTAAGAWFTGAVACGILYEVAKV